MENRYQEVAQFREELAELAYSERPILLQEALDKTERFSAKYGMDHHPGIQLELGRISFYRVRILMRLEELDKALSEAQELVQLFALSEDPNEAEIAADALLSIAQIHILFNAAAEHDAAYAAPNADAAEHEAAEKAAYEEIVQRFSNHRHPGIRHSVADAQRRLVQRAQNSQEVIAQWEKMWAQQQFCEYPPVMELTLDCVPYYFEALRMLGQSPSHEFFTDFIDFKEAYDEVTGGKFHLEGQNSQAWCLLKLGRFEQALEVTQEGIEKTEQMPILPAQRKLASFMSYRARCYEGLGRPAKEIAALTKLIQHFGIHSDVQIRHQVIHSMHNLGWCYRNIGDEAAAAQEFLAAGDLFGDSDGTIATIAVRSLIQAGRSQVILGTPLDSIKSLTKALEANCRMLAVQGHSAELEALLGDTIIEFVTAWTIAGNLAAAKAAADYASKMPESIVTPSHQAALHDAASALPQSGPLPGSTATWDPYAQFIDAFLSGASSETWPSIAESSAPNTDDSTAPEVPLLVLRPTLAGRLLPSGWLSVLAICVVTMIVVIMLGGVATYGLAQAFSQLSHPPSKLIALLVFIALPLIVQAIPGIFGKNEVALLSDALLSTTSRGQARHPLAGLQSARARLNWITLQTDLWLNYSEGAQVRVSGWMLRRQLKLMQDAIAQ